MRTNRFHITFEDARHKFKIRINALEALKDQISRIQVMWECRWTEMKLTDPEVKAFVKAFDKTPIPPPMALREAFR